MADGALFPAGLLERDCYPRAVAYYFKQWNGFRMPFHTHDDIEIMYIISGICRVEIAAGHAPPDTVTLKKGEFIILNANHRHRLLVDEHSPCRMLNVEFRFMDGSGTPPSVGQLAAEEEELRVLLSFADPYLVLRDPDEVFHTLKSLVLELDSRRAHNGSMVHILLMQLMIRIARLHRESEVRGSLQVEFYVKKSISFLHQNYDRDIHVKDVASFVNLHPGYLHRIFKAHTGSTLTHYLTELRMEKAKMLLLHTTIPVLEICDYVGVGSRQYFHSLFKKHTGLTPAEFRKTMFADTHTQEYFEESDDF